MIWPDSGEFIPFHKQAVDASNCAAIDDKAVAWKSWAPIRSRNEGVRTFIDMGTPLGGAGGISFAQFLAGEPACYHKIIDNVTRTGVTLKTSPDMTFLWASNLKDASPSGSAAVELRSDDNKVLWQGKTDSKGMAFAPGWRGTGGARSAASLFPAA